MKPLFRYDVADTILALDCDFIGGEEDAHNSIRQFTAKRKIEKPEDGLNRLYAVESLFTLTGVNADHRLRVAAGAVIRSQRPSRRNWASTLKHDGFRLPKLILLIARSGSPSARRI